MKNAKFSVKTISIWLGVIIAFFTVGGQIFKVYFAPEQVQAASFNFNKRFEDYDKRLENINNVLNQHEQSINDVRSDISYIKGNTDMLKLFMAEQSKSMEQIKNLLSRR